MLDSMENGSESIFSPSIVTMHEMEQENNITANVESWVTEKQTKEEALNDIVVSNGLINEKGDMDGSSFKYGYVTGGVCTSMRRFCL